MNDPRAEAFSAHRRGDLANAEQRYLELLQTAPADAELHYCLGLLCHQSGRLPESARWLRSALTLAPRSLPALQLLIRVCDETGDAQGALTTLEHYLALKPDDAGMLNVKGQQLVRLGRLRDAEAAFQCAAEASGGAAMFHDLGLCRQLLGDKDGAARAFEDALRRGHDRPRTRLWLAQCLRATGNVKEYYDVAVAAAGAYPDDIEILVEAQAARRHLCDWRGFDLNRPPLLAGLKRVLTTHGGPDIPPSILNYLDIDEATIAAIARRYATQLSDAAEPLQRSLPERGERRAGTKIRLGYLSTDFFSHAVGSLVADVFAQHDRDRFEIYGYSLRHQPDAVQMRIQQGCDRYRNLSGAGMERVARSIRDDQIDILIDLAGYTSAAQPVAVAARPAPLQISWLGYLGTSGGDFIDYIIADDIALPAGVAKNYRERIIRLPRFMVASSLPVAENKPSRSSLGLRDDEFIFCSFNQPYKIDGTTFDAWMEILRRAPRSRLWMYVPDPEACAERLRDAAARLDVQPDRLVFAGREPMARHVARMALADLALDPFHISGGATSVAALAAGVPTLTLRGDSFLARMGSSINTSLGMADIDCSSRGQYVDRAVELATSPAALAETRTRLAGRIQASGFFDSRSFVHQFEAALQTVWTRHLAGLSPADIEVSEQT